MTIILTNEIYNANNNGRHQNTNHYHLYARILAPFLVKSDFCGCFKFPSKNASISEHVSFTFD
jgi:hypothetical protein